MKQKNYKSAFNKSETLKLILVILIFLLLFLSFTANGNSSPDLDPDESCHETGPYEISSETDDKITVDKGEEFIIDIKGEGPDVWLRFNPASQDNEEFDVEPTDEYIKDNSKYDENDDKDIISVNFTLEAPNKEGKYDILFYVRSPSGSPPGKPYIDFIEFEITVEKATQDPLSGNIFFNSIFNHYNIYLGIISFVALTIGIILSEINYRKFVRTHGLLLMLAMILTTINLIFIFTESLDTFIGWFFSTTIDWLHFLHFISGIIGYGACIVGMLTGISGIRHRKSGYVTLICWGFNFIYGLIYWGINLGV